MNDSIWLNETIPPFPALRHPRQYDVVVIGGGITGLSCAYFLKRAGKRVCVLERRRIGGGETGFTTAQLTAVTDSRLSKLAKCFGLPATKLIWDAGEIAINVVEQIVREHELSCQFKRVPGYLIESLLVNDRKDSEQIHALEEDGHTASQIGVDVHLEGYVPVFRLPGLHFNNQATLHPTKYLAAMAKIIQGDGCEVFEDSEVTEVSDKPLKVTGKHFEIECDKIIIATHVPLMGKATMTAATLFQTKVAPYSTYVVGMRLPKALVEDLSIWDTSDPYFYLRLDRNEEFGYALFGGCDHKTGQKDDGQDRFLKLERMLQRTFPTGVLDHRWSGQVIETHDGLPFIGESTENQFIATGFAGNGITFGTFAGIMARDWVLETKNPWQELFSPHRKELHAGGPWTYLKENLDYPAYLFKDALLLRPEPSSDCVPNGEGKIVMIDGHRAACYRDESGVLHSVSARCTHLGCTVHWNKAERTWDCPCHGSRFTPDGEVIGGPATKALHTVKERTSHLA